MSTRFAARYARHLMWAALLGVCAALAQAATPLIPVQQFAAGPEMSAPRISPDGTHLAYLTTFKGERFVAVHDLQAGTTVPIMRASKDSFYATNCDFKTDQRLLCHFRGIIHNPGVPPLGGSRLVVVDRDGKNVKVLFQDSQYSNAAGITRNFYQDRLLHMLPDDPRHVLIEMGDRSSGFPSVYQLDLETGALRLVVPHSEPVLGWTADRDGVVRFGAGFRHKDAVYIARNGPDAPWRTLAKFKRFDYQQFEPLSFGPLPNQLFVAAPYQGRAAVWQMDLDEKSDFQLVFARPDVDVDSIITWPTDEHLVGYFYEDDRPHIEFVDLHARAINETMNQVVPNTFHRFLDASRDGHTIVIESYSDVVPPVYHLLNTSTRTLTALGEHSKVLARAQLAPTQSIVIPGPGGINIHGYLTLPVGTAPGKPIAAVVFPHGGPYARDEWGYDPMVQLMANRGYAVLQLNYRGSTGYGDEWRLAGYQAWGTIMHEDITAGAHWLVQQGIADAARMCIVGWSYGGYAALIGVVKEPQLYKCAVSIAGVADVSKLAWEYDLSYGGKDAVQESTGTDKALLAAESPVLHAERIKVPVLLVHGDEDSTVPLEQSEAMAKALKRAGVPHELVVIKDGGHSLAEPAMRLTLYSKLEAFLAANLGSP